MKISRKYLTVSSHLGSKYTSILGSSSERDGFGSLNESEKSSSVEKDTLTISPLESSSLSEDERVRSI
jgi:hypothetical protein